MSRASTTTDGPAPDRLELYWIPLGAGAHVVRVSGAIYEGLMAGLQRRPRRALYHAALVAYRAGVATTVEVAPVPDGDGRVTRGVVAEGIVGSRLIGWLRVFRYEVRCWPGGDIPDLTFAVASPVTLTDERAGVDAVLGCLPDVPTPVWGRDELGNGEMWNSNSVVAWALCRSGLLAAAGTPPAGGRAPGWDAGVQVGCTGRRRLGPRGTGPGSVLSPGPGG